jgi:hypothetical protein
VERRGFLIDWDLSKWVGPAETQMGPAEKPADKQLESPDKVRQPTRTVNTITFLVVCDTDWNV